MSSDAIPAATLILMRDRADGPPDILMVERAATMAFVGGATVFPGGRIDPGDGALAPGEDGAARVAAIRETIEETGIAVAIAGDRPAVALRAAIAEGTGFAAALAKHGATLAPERLVPFARWRPDQPGMRNFDTRFFVAEAREAAEPVADGGESVAAEWRPAQDWLDAAERGEVRLIFPTRRVLERLARFASYAEAVADAGAYPPVTVTPWVEDRDGVPHLCLPEGIGYPVTAVPLDAAGRG